VTIPTTLAICFDALLGEYREDSARFRSWGDEMRAAMLDRVVSDVERVIHDAGDELLTLADASREGGYSERQLRRMLDNGIVQDMGRQNAPRIRRSDVPRKPGYLPPVKPTLHIGRTPGQIAQSFSIARQEK
jgi:hypothetical protein